ncbi:MAG TPA: hypothetical protein VJW75_09600 [Candidatus Eisenbacteria bacterium]|nr:hypothetical protein [Candidatus Eisenbacteria bacterium]
MSRHLALLSGVLALVAVAFLLFAGSPARAQTALVGPTDILLVDADSVLFVRTVEWLSLKTRHQEKLLLTSLRMRYWRDHIPSDMRMVFDALGYPTGRVLTTPVGHTEEWWYYGQLRPPLRFRDGILLDVDEFDALRTP